MVGVNLLVGVTLLAGVEVNQVLLKDWVQKYRYRKDLDLVAAEVVVIVYLEGVVYLEAVELKHLEVAVHLEAAVLKHSEAVVLEQLEAAEKHHLLKVLKKQYHSKKKMMKGISNQVFKTSFIARGHGNYVVIIVNINKSILDWSLSQIKVYLKFITLNFI